MFSTGNKNQNCQLNMKFGTYTNSDMQNLMTLFTFSIFDWQVLPKNPFDIFMLPD